MLVLLVLPLLYLPNFFLSLNHRTPGKCTSGQETWVGSGNDFFLICLGYAIYSLEIAAPRATCICMQMMVSMLMRGK